MTMKIKRSIPRWKQLIDYKKPMISLGMMYKVDIMTKYVTELEQKLVEFSECYHRVGDKKRQHGFLGELICFELECVSFSKWSSERYLGLSTAFRGTAIIDQIFERINTLNQGVIMLTNKTRGEVLHQHEEAIDVKFQ